MITANYTTQQVAQMTGRNVETVRIWIRDGKLKGRKPPGCRDYIVMKSDFELFWFGAIQPEARE